MGSRAMRAPQFIRGFFNTVNTEVVSRWRATRAENHGGGAWQDLLTPSRRSFCGRLTGSLFLSRAHDAPAHAIDELQCFAPTEMPCLRFRSVSPLPWPST